MLTIEMIGKFCDFIWYDFDKARSYEIFKNRSYWTVFITKFERNHTRFFLYLREREKQKLIDAINKKSPS